MGIESSFIPHMSVILLNYGEEFSCQICKLHFYYLLILKPCAVEVDMLQGLHIIIIEEFVFSTSDDGYVLIAKEFLMSCNHVA